jgi:hypothetical protein
LAAGAPRVAARERPSPPKIKPTADRVIVLWMGGGMAHTETFDPKRYTPYSTGLDANAVLSTFPSIPTGVDGVRFSEGLEQLASVMDRGTLIRTMQARISASSCTPGTSSTGTPATCRRRPWQRPHLGAWISRILGPADPAVPAFINIGQRLRPRRRRGAEGLHHRRFSR